MKLDTFEKLDPNTLLKLVVHNKSGVAKTLFENNSGGRLKNGTFKVYVYGKTLTIDNSKSIKKLSIVELNGIACEDLEQIEIANGYENALYKSMSIMLENNLSKLKHEFKGDF